MLFSLLTVAASVATLVQSLALPHALRTTSTQSTNCTYTCPRSNTASGPLLFGELSDDSMSADFLGCAYGPVSASGAAAICEYNPSTGALNAGFSSACPPSALFSYACPLFDKSGLPLTAANPQDMYTPGGDICEYAGGESVCSYNLNTGAYAVGWGGCASQLVCAGVTLFNPEEYN